MAGAGFPQLAGQWADYVAGQAQGLEERHHLGRRRQREDHADRSRSASSDSDIAALASYVEGLHTRHAQPPRPSESEREVDTVFS